MEFLTLASYLLVILFMTKQLAAFKATGTDSTTRLAEKFAVRSHKLIEQGVMIDHMPYSFDKHARYANWTAELREYLSDFEEELRISAKADRQVVIFNIPLTVTS